MSLKKILSFVLAGFIMLTIAVVNINADTIIKEVEGKVYTLIETDKCDGSFIGLTLDKSEMYMDEYYLNIYKKDSTSTCTLLTKQQSLDYLNNDYKKEYYKIAGTKILKVTEEIFQKQALILTNDTIPNEEKIYYDNEGNEISKPYNPENIGQYYEFRIFVKPTEVNKDNDITYYSIFGAGTFVAEQVDDIPDEAEVFTYWVKYEDEAYSIEEVATYDEELWNPIISTLEAKISNGTLVDTGISELNGKLVLAFKISNLDAFDNNTFIAIYDIAGNNLKEIADVGASGYFEAIGNYALVLMDVAPNELIIYNDDFESLYVVNGIYHFIPKTYSNILKVFTTGATDKTLLIKSYETIEGKNQVFNNNDLTFKFSGELDKLSKVKINDTELSSDNYNLESGSTIITLNKSFLSTLESGTYTLKVEYADGGYSSTTFTIGEENPQTFDNIMSYVMLGGIGLTGIASIALIMKKKKNNYNL